MRKKCYENVTTLSNCEKYETIDSFSCFASLSPNFAQIIRHFGQSYYCMIATFRNFDTECLKKRPPVKLILVLDAVYFETPCISIPCSLVHYQILKQYFCLKTMRLGQYKSTTILICFVKLRNNLLKLGTKLKKEERKK